jgi:twitching motility protein PilU
MALDINDMLQQFVEMNGSDLYLTVGASPSMRINSQVKASKADKLKEEDIRAILKELVSDEVINEFDSTLEYNTAINWKDKARFRVNIFRQRQHSGIVIRRIQTVIPSLEGLKLPKVYADLIMEKRGLILIVGPTGSGKSTSMAAMLEHRNQTGTGHIVTIEDPVEFVLEHKNCIITQRDVGIDTYSFGIGLKNALRQSPDIIVIGEIRDRETMEHAITFAETGHLCMATLHANNSNQAIERIINFFPEEKHKQVLQNLSFNVKGILSQRLVRTKDDSRCLAVEIMLNQGLIKNLIQEGRIKEIRECIEKGSASGMQTFDQCLINLYTKGIITEEQALAESDNPANLRLNMTQHNMSKRTGPYQAQTPGPEAITNRKQF